MTIEVVETVARVRQAVATARRERPGIRVGLVPTMGALHAGHLALIQQCKNEAGFVVVSIFVNPTQFGPAEDFERYPRPFAEDLRLAESVAANLVFAPQFEGMYPAGPESTFVEVPGLSDVLEGASRPGHFRGVATVVLKLFQLTWPDVAVFGAKDAQQLALVRQMVTDLDLGVRIEAAPLHRDPDGMATSSRNRYLSAAERESALALSRALAAGAAAAAAGHPPAAVLAESSAVLGAAAAARPPVKVDYLALVDPVSFAEVAPDHRGPALLLVAATVGTTRLIDNASIAFGGGQ